VATEAAWLNGNNMQKKKQRRRNKEEERKKRQNERKDLTLTGLLMEGVEPYVLKRADAQKVFTPRDVTKKPTDRNRGQDIYNYLLQSSNHIQL
jgi:hypothetical protein